MAKIDDSVKKKVPELRFKGFTDEWEERKLGEIFNYEQPTKYIVKSTEYDDNFNTPVLTAGKSFLLGYTDEISGIKNATVENPVVIFDDFTTGSHYVDFPFKIKSSAMKLLSLNDNSDNFYFMFNTLKNIKYVPQSHERHWISKFSSFVIYKPSQEEQQKIGSFFKQLDATIALHQHKLDLLKEQKKGFLQKMFPKNGEKVPELRFEGFTDDWEERKLEDISEIIDGDRGKNYPSGDDFKNNGHTLFLSAANVTKQGFVFKETQYITKLKSESLGSGKVILNDIILTSRGSIGHIGFYDKKTHEYIPQARINSGMLILRTDKLNSPSFIAQFLKSPWGIKQIKLISFGSAQPQLTKKDIKNFKIILPKMEEQQKIGSFFKQLDDSIALHQRKLDLLKEQRKGFLQKMFV
ncbi:restriction endonuclease subunit S [Enterococcus lactis]|uniref:restriction endonuclease subunit S n=1 Tax=Enterococcus lactis TaxID=357441 RepID=UPI001BD0391D|nr:restriction endonuclease subunit S [Enterococcus lactis]